MKILMVNKFFYVMGGSETYYFALKRLLESRGHTVVDFSMKDSRNFPSPYSQYFVDHVDYNDQGGMKQKIQSALKIIYSREAKRKFEELILAEKPDIVHLHIFQHQISPSILDVIKKYHIPCVYTAHELKMLCPNYKMMHQGILCEKCQGGKYYHCVHNRCVKDSFLKSCINMAEGYFHKWRGSYDAIGLIITPSEFYRNKFLQFGISPQRVTCIPNFLDREKPMVSHLPDREQYYLYFGRLSKEKGIMTFLQAALKTGIRAKIIGTGALEYVISSFLRENRMTNVEMLGFQSGQKLADYVGNAKAVVLPSEWYENCPYSAIEALQLGRPIIGARIGGIPELVEDNGYLFESGNPEDLQSVILKMEALSESAYQSFCENSCRLFEKKYSQKLHYDRIRSAYAKVGVYLERDNSVAEETESINAGIQM